MILDKIVQVKYAEVAERQVKVPQVELLARVAGLPITRDFKAAIAGKESVSLIAEVKQASPSKGLICRDFDPVRLAGQYHAGGAAAISVLTDEQFFRGSLDFLSLIRAKVALPLLRKDFVIDSYQIVEARAAGADALLLIARILAPSQLQEFISQAAELGLAALVEVHDEQELAQSIAAGATIIGINNRDLATFNTDLAVTLRLAQAVPLGYVLVSESGIHAAQDVKRMQAAGIDAVLVGEALAKADNVVEATEQMVLGGKS